MTAKQTEFEAKVKESLDESVLALDQETHEALASIRQKALEQHNAKSWLNLNRWVLNQQLSNTWIPAGAFGLCTLLLVFFITHSGNIIDSTNTMTAKSSPDQSQYEQITMLDLLAQPEDIETTTDPDFYVWVEEVLATEDSDNAV
ncbi:MAG: hypothetical protein ACO1N8_02945 [Methylophilus sp.]